MPNATLRVFLPEQTLRSRKHCNYLDIHHLFAWSLTPGLAHQQCCCSLPVSRLLWCIQANMSANRCTARPSFANRWPRYQTLKRLPGRIAHQSY